MKNGILLIIVSVLAGFGAGYWGGNSSKGHPANEYYAIARDNSVLLKNMADRINQFETESVPRHVAGDCQSYSGLLSSIRKTITDSIKSLSTDSAIAVTAANESSAPSQEQVQLYDTVKKRIYNYATSGQPIMEAMSEDPDIQNLTHEQQRQLAMDVIERFNRGEITMSQIKGH